MVRYSVLVSSLVALSLCGGATAVSAANAARDREARANASAREPNFFNLFGATAAPSPNAARGREARVSALAPAARSSKLFFGFYAITPREVVSYPAKHAPGTIIVKQSERRLYYILGGGQALRYAIAVGREGAAWAGVSSVSSKREWPDWTPTPAILARQPDLPRHMEGGPANPLGARALYLGATLYRIHGTNEPWMIGESTSAGCIRLSNADVIDLYERTRIGATVIVQR